mgnify:FL=1
MSSKGIELRIIKEKRMSIYKIFSIISIITFSFMFANCPGGEDVCLSLDGNDLNYDISH